MRALLERWARLQPERCQVGEYYAYFSLDGFQFRLWHDDVLTPRRSATLLAAVIEAVTNRDWLLDLEIMRGSTIATINRSTENWSHETLHPHAAATPAEAALTAYLSALETETNP